MAIVDDERSNPAFVVLEDFSQPTGHLIFVDTNGIRLDLPKSLEPTSQDPSKLYLGHTLDEIINSPNDLLADQILAKPGDPDYNEVASVFPPIRKIPTYSFVGTNNTMDKVGFAYGGRSPNFEPTPYYAPISKIRDEGRVLDGLVGGSLPTAPAAWTGRLYDSANHPVADAKLTLAQVPGGPSYSVTTTATVSWIQLLPPDRVGFLRPWAGRSLPGGNC